MTVRNRTQRYAEAALARIDVVKNDKDLRGEYKSRADNLPVMVMQAGLAQALGFLLAKSKGDVTTPYGRYLADLAIVLQAGGAGSFASGEALQHHVIKAPLSEYRRLTRETLAAAGWLKRFCQAYIKKDDKKKDSGAVEEATP
ncbi:MAG: type III-B CRISPR module-associated protein Cmr5 [Sulfuricella sp.]